MLDELIKASENRSQLVDLFSKSSFSEAVNNAAWFICPAFIFPKVFTRFIEFKLQEMEGCQEPSVSLLVAKVDFQQVKKIKRNDRLIFGSIGPNSVFDFFNDVLIDAFPKKKDQVCSRLILSLIDKLGVPTQCFNTEAHKENFLVPSVGDVSEDEVFHLAELHTRNLSNRIASLVGLPVPWVNPDFGVDIQFEKDLQTAINRIGHQRLPLVRSDIDAIGGELIKAIADHIIFGGTHLFSTHAISMVLTRLDSGRSGRYFFCKDSLRLPPRYLPFAAAASSACASMGYKFVQEGIAERDRVALAHEKQSALKAIDVISCEGKFLRAIEELKSGNLNSDIFGHTMNFSSGSSALREFVNDLVALDDLMGSDNKDATESFQHASTATSEEAVFEAYIRCRCLEADLLGGDWRNVIRESSFPELLGPISTFIDDQKSQGVLPGAYLNVPFFYLLDSAVSECFEFLGDHPFVTYLADESRDAFVEGEQELISRLNWKPTPKVPVQPDTWNSVLNSYARSVEAELLYSLVNPELNRIVDDEDSFSDSYLEHSVKSGDSALYAKILIARRRQKKNTSSLSSNKSDPCLGDMLFLFKYANHLPKDIHEDSPLLTRICAQLINGQTAPIFDPSSLLLLAEINEFRKDGSHPRSNESDKKVTRERASFARRMIVAYLQFLSAIKSHSHASTVLQLLMGENPVTYLKRGSDPFKSLR